MSTDVNVNFGGFFVGALTVLFIGLKLTGHVAWSWWWVLAPMWMSAALAFVIFIIVMTVIIVKRG